MSIRMTIRPAAGGADAQLFAHELMGSYIRLSDRKG